MELNWLESLLFGVVSGLTEILPVSSQAHQALVLKIFGAGTNPLLRIIVHAAVFEALFIGCREQISAMMREQRIAATAPRRRPRQPDQRKVLDFKLLKTAMIPMLLGLLAYPFLDGIRSNLLFCAAFLVVNGIILYVPMHSVTGNKDSRSMSAWDSVLIGLAGAISVLPGISRVAATVSAAIARGASKEFAVRWSLFLSLPFMLGLILVDLYSLISFDLGQLSGGMILNFALAAAGAYIGAYAAISALRFMAVKVGFSGFSYYCWGTALFSLIMYLIT